MLSLKGRRANTETANGREHRPMLSPMGKLSSVRRRRAAAAASAGSKGAEGPKKLSSREEAEQAQLAVKDELAVTHERHMRRDADLYDLIERQEEMLAHQEERQRRLREKHNPHDSIEVPALHQEDEGEVVSVNDEDCVDETTETPEYEEGGEIISMKDGEGDRRVVLSCSTDDDKENEKDLPVSKSMGEEDLDEDLWDVIDGYRDNIEALSKRNKRLEIRLKKMPKEIETACQQVLNAIQKMAEQQRTISALTTENESLKRKVSDMEEKDAATSKELALLKEHVLRRQRKHEKRRMARSRERRPHSSARQSPLPGCRRKTLPAAPPRRCSSADAASERRRRQGGKDPDKRAESDGEGLTEKPSSDPTSPTVEVEPRATNLPNETIGDVMRDVKEHEMANEEQDGPDMATEPPPVAQPISRTSSFKLWPPSPRRETDHEEDDIIEDELLVPAKHVLEDDDSPTLPSSEELHGSGGTLEFLQIQDIDLPGQSLLRPSNFSYGHSPEPSQLRRTERRLRSRSQREGSRKKLKEKPSPSRRRQRDASDDCPGVEKAGTGSSRRAPKNALQLGEKTTSRRSMLMRRRKTPPKQRSATASSSSDNGPNANHEEGHES